MWLLIFIIFNSPLEIKHMSILETHFAHKNCVSRMNQAINIGLPPNTNLGCIYLRAVSKS